MAATVFDYLLNTFSLCKDIVNYDFFTDYTLGLLRLWTGKNKGKKMKNNQPTLYFLNAGFENLECYEHREGHSSSSQQKERQLR